MRPVASLYCILSLVAGLVYAPFFHFHADDHAELHAHFEALHADAAPHDDDHESEIEESLEEHDGTAVSVFVGKIPKVATTFIAIEETRVVATSLPLIGFTLAQPVRAHDPPHLRLSNPRSPPA